MRKYDTHHHNKVEYKEKGEAAGVAQKACEGRDWSQKGQYEQQAVDQEDWPLDSDRF